ncbi:phosphatidylserine/phosphatidylglycerophosphate/cardiolipin synthase family protein [Plantactinospora sp. ZYX-F-223]|uniref:phospholipase D-like domain-containing protein n=1 Tax=Plantactinospora sp. ZYX-F-223 TaxID=3144103 RepID=UPI0031FD35A2
MPDGAVLPEELDLGAVTAPEGYFLLRNAPGQPFLDAPDADREYRHRFTYRGSVTSIRRAAIELIQGARHKIFLASFRIGDRELLDALFAAVDRLHGGVYVVTSWTEQSLKRDLSSLEDVDEVDVQAQKKRFDELTRRGIALRGHEGCHAKFLVVDDSVALVSSANLETSALVDTERKRATGENGVLVGDPAEVDRLARFFTRLWFAGCTWAALPGAEYALHRRTPAPSPVTVPPLAGGPGVIWTYDGEDGAGPHRERGILDAVHDVIGRARRELLLATFSLVGIRDRPDLLLDPLRRAMAAHDLDVRLLVRARNNVPEHRADTAALAELGVTVHGDSDTHAKGVIADGRYGALFSANFDAVHGMFSGVEVGTRLDGRPALAEARRYFRHAMEHADLAFVPAPTQRELDQGLGARWRRRWPHGERLTVSAADADWRRLVDAAATGPVLWEEAKDLRLYVGDVVATLRPARSARFQLTVAESRPDAVTRMRDWYAERPGTGTGTARPKRGCCPALLTRLR